MSQRVSNVAQADSPLFHSTLGMRRKDQQARACDATDFPERL
jgi:hypothetical protein